MTEIANLATGELNDYQPMNPLELEYLIVEIGNRLEASVPALRDLWAARYAAERELIEAEAKALLRSTFGTVTERRAESRLSTLEVRRKFDDAKEILHAAEALQKALQARLFGMQNLNRVQGSAYNAGGIGVGR